MNVILKKLRLLCILTLTMLVLSCKCSNLEFLLTGNNEKIWKSNRSDNFYLSFNKHNHLMRLLDHNGYVEEICRPYPNFRIDGKKCITYLMYPGGYTYVLDTLEFLSISKENMRYLSHKDAYIYDFTMDYDIDVSDCMTVKHINFDILRRIRRLNKESPINLLSECSYIGKDDFDSLGLSISYVPDNRGAECIAGYEIGKPVKRNQSIYCWAYNEILNVDKEGRPIKDYLYGIEFEYKKRHNEYEFKRKRRYRLK